jgi:serine/threonine-protein kinase
MEDLMARCPSCSREFTEAGKFCPWCATPVDASSAETAVLPPAVSPPPSASNPVLATSSAVDEGRFLPGTLLASRYRIAGLLGRGGMGEVYRATDLTLGQAVALKFLPEAASSDERALARFYNEVRIARQVTHPNVCRVYDVGQVDGLEFISMEYVDGEDLAVLLRRIGRLPVDKAVETARQICAGLAAAHEKGVLHRDLKPANIMIDGRGQAVIMDFGLAGLSAQLQGDARSGTPAYMSPEQLAGSEVTFKSDIYALGLLLYELFTGKRAFEAGTLMDLMRMQEQAKPASLTTLVRELDPAVERVVLRCLNPDPRQRPASALAVSAALPGGDPLAAALAAGETPTPELVAAAGETEGMRPVLAIAWLAAALVLTAVAGFVGPKMTLSAKVPLDIAPAAMAHQARLMLEGFGYSTRPADTALGFDIPWDYRAYLDGHPDLAARRWRNPTAGLPPLVGFWYRESPRSLVGTLSLNTIPRYMDPPLDVSGMIRMYTDREGHLYDLSVVPLQKEGPQAGAPAFDWTRLFTAAGFDMAQWQPVPPEWTTLANWDARAAWTRTDPITGSVLRVEAAAWRGRPVFFRLIGDWTKPERMQDSAGDHTPWPVLVLIYLIFAAACCIAWFNHKQGKGDKRGALALAVLGFVCMAGGRYLATPHSTSIEEIDTFWRVVAVAGINAGLAWILYLALEPWVRRRWPHTMIGWTRYVAKGIRDPLVGRDLLIGTAAGALFAVVTYIQLACHGASGPPNIPAFGALTGVRHFVYLLSQSVFNSLFTSILLFFMFFVLRVVLRKQWLATLAFITLTTLIIAGPGSNWIDRPFQAAYAALFAFILLRFGLMALMVSFVTSDILGNVPWSAEPSALNVGALAIVAILAIYGFRTALAGRPILRGDLL